MPTYKHKDWETAKGTWLITSQKMDDEQIIQLIKSDPTKYGSLEDWFKVK